MSPTTDNNSGEAQAKRLENVYEQLAALVRQPDIAKRLKVGPGADEWSAMQVVGHMVEMIPYWLDACRTLIAAVEPPQFGRTHDAPERLAGVERGAISQPDELVRLLGAEVQAAARTIRQMTPAERAKKGLHVRRGEMSVAEIVESTIVAHAEDHLAQVSATLQT